MILELASQEKVVGVKQSRKAIREGRVKRVYLACDADPAITTPVAETCQAAGTRRRNLTQWRSWDCLPDYGGSVRSRCAV